MRGEVQVDADDIQRAIRGAGQAGRPVCAHSSLRSFGYVVGGPVTVIQAFLDRGCTLLVPTLSFDYEVPPPADDRPLRNGCDYSDYHIKPHANPGVFSPKTNQVDPSMGAIPAAVLAMKGRVRGDHPVNSFAAIGPLAEELLATQHRCDVNAPMKKLVEHQGAIVMMGVGLTAMTALHLAEERAGREPFRRWTAARDGQPLRMMTGSCSVGFASFDGVLAPWDHRREVGKSLWRIFPAAAAVAAAGRAIRANPSITHCRRPDCLRCRDAAAGGPMIGVTK